MRATVPPAFFLGVTAFFVWSSAHGDRGWDAIGQRRLLLDALKTEQIKVDAERAVWEHKVAGLKPPIDPDSLDERARAMLNLSDPSDIVVYWPVTPKP